MKKSILTIVAAVTLISISNVSFAEDRGACYITIEKPPGTVIERACNDRLDSYTCTNFVESFLKKNMKDRNAKINHGWVEGKRCVELAPRMFFKKAIGTNGPPEKVTIDQSGSNKAARDDISALLAIFVAIGYGVYTIVMGS